MKNILKEGKNMKSSMTGEDVWYYIQGNVRSYMYYTNWWFLPLHIFIPAHVLQQMVVRLNTIEGSKCYEKGSCKHCGCKVPPLTFCNKACEGNCYPKMINKKDWLSFKLNKARWFGLAVWVYAEGKFKLSI